MEQQNRVPDRFTQRRIARVRDRLRQETKMRHQVQRRVVGGLLGLAALVLPAGSHGDDASDRQKLVGTWQGYLAEPRGDRPGPVRFSEVVISAERIRARRLDGSDMGEGTYQLGANGRARTLDANGLSGEPRGKTFLGIYEIQGDTLRWCMANPGKPRPEEFMSRPGGGQFLMVLRRKP